MPTISLYVNDKTYQFLSKKAGKTKKPAKIASEILEQAAESEKQ